MIRLFGLFSILLLLALGSFWLLGDSDSERAARLPRLLTIELEPLRQAAIQTLREAAEAVAEQVPRAEEGAPLGPDASSPEPKPPVLEAPPLSNAAPSPVEEIELPEQAPFTEAPKREADPGAPPPGLAPPDEPLVVAARDQDAWAALIRRMLELHRRAGEQ